MPIFSLFSNDFLPKGLSFDVFSMPPKDVNNFPNAASANGGASILIFISAQALSSVGFAVSIFAIWFGWLLPAFLTAPAPVAVESPEIKKTHKTRLPPRHPRRSEPIDSGSKLTPVRRASAPVDLTPILVPRSDDVHNNDRRVYFADTPRIPIIRRNTMPDPKYPPISQQSAQTVETTSFSSTSTQLNVECDEETLPDFASLLPSSKASLTPSSRLQKLKLGLTSKVIRPEVADKQVDQASIASTDTNTSDKSARRASDGTFVAAWTLSRHRAVPDVGIETSSHSPSRLSFARRMSPSRPSTSPPIYSSAADILSPTFLSRKSQKRVSAPIPRTSPYGAPYFAAPPLLLDKNYPAYLKTLPQFEDEIHGSASNTSDSEDGERCRGRTPGIRRVNLNPPRRMIPKRRSASEDCTQRTECKS